MITVRLLFQPFPVASRPSRGHQQGSKLIIHNASPATITSIRKHPWVRDVNRYEICDNAVPFGNQLTLIIICQARWSFYVIYLIFSNVICTQCNIIRSAWEILFRNLTGILRMFLAPHRGLKSTQVPDDFSGFLMSKIFEIYRQQIF